MFDLPEIELLHSAGLKTGSQVRIPPSDSVPLSDRARRIIDSVALRRLAGISQLGLVSLVYPGACHSRLEHTLGVYHHALKLLARFQRDRVAGKLVDRRSGDAFLLAALLHDVGHWPFCHPIEDMKLEHLPVHESRLEMILADRELASLIEEDWHCDADDVMRLICGERVNSRPGSESGGASGGEQANGWTFLASCLSGPVDVDKLDYLQRDSLHCGVPYGRNFDADRLISSLSIDPDSSRLAIGEKGRTAAEMMVFARYVMFSEVYWHHTVRAATAMLQRSVFLLHNRMDLASTLSLSDVEWIALLRRTAEGSLAEPLVEGLFGARRRLFKPVAEFSSLSGCSTHAQLARRPYPWIVSLSERVAARITAETQVAISPADILVDAPPVQLEVDINCTVLFRDGRRAMLGDVSPVAAVLAKQQFDDHVKRVRVFVRPDLREELGRYYHSPNDWAKLLADSTGDMNSDGTDSEA